MAYQAEDREPRQDENKGNTKEAAYDWLWWHCPRLVVDEQVGRL